MAKKKRPQRPSPTRRPAGDAHAPEVQEAVNEAVALLERGEFIAAIDLLEELREDYPRESLFAKLLGTAYAELGLLLPAADYWEEATNLDPADAAVWRTLAGAYGQLGYYTHALRALRRYLGLESDDDDRAEIEAARQELDTILAETSKELGVALRDAERGTVLLERALRASMAGDYTNAARQARDAARVLPGWAPPRNLLALAQFQLGKGDEALATTERLLGERPDDLHALANLTRFLWTLGRRNEAQVESDRLVALLERADTAEASPDPFERERAAEAFALLGQDERVVAALDSLPRERGSEFARLLLGAALANLGRKNEALELFTGLETHPRAARFATALQLNETPPGDRFVALSPAELLPSGMLDEALAKLVVPAGDVALERAALTDLANQTPTLLPALFVSLWLGDAMTAARAVDLLLLLDLPEARETLRSFALGRLGDDEVRLHAAIALRDRGELDTSRPLVLWQEGRYQQLILPRYELDQEEQPARPYPLPVRKLMARAIEQYEAGDIDSAAKLYAQVLDQDPAIEDAEQHLGLIELLRGNREAAEPHLRRAFELNPDAVLARCTLASFRIGQHRLADARDLLAPLADRTRFRPSELAAYLFTTAELAASEGDADRARAQLRLLLAYVPAHGPALVRLRDLEREEVARRQEGAGAARVARPSGLWTPGSRE